MRTRSLVLAAGLLLLASAASGQPPLPVVERVLPPGAVPVVPQPALPRGLPVAPLAPPVIPPPLPTAQEKQLAEHLADLVKLHHQLKELDAKRTEEQRKTAGPFVVGRVVL